jgi:hypothetical protein
MHFAEAQLFGVLSGTADFLGTRATYGSIDAGFAF